MNTESIMYVCTPYMSSHFPTPVGFDVDTTPRDGAFAATWRAASVESIGVELSQIKKGIISIAFCCLSFIILD